MLCPTVEAERFADWNAKPISGKLAMNSLAISSAVNGAVCATQVSRFTSTHCAIGVPFGSTPLKSTSCQCAGKWIQPSR